MIYTAYMDRIIIVKLIIYKESMEEKINEYRGMENINII
jgi:hypothetical protein